MFIKGDFMHSNNPIGVFDSGIGGLSVVKQIMTNLPSENIIYFGDIARIPYGTKSVATIRQFTRQTVQFLIKKRVKAIVIACNTISAVAIDTVKELAKDIPVIDVISCGITQVINSQFKQIGVIATPATIKSGAYTTQINQLNPNISVISQACPLFVPMIEEDIDLNHIALRAIADDYLAPLKQYTLDALILGCTHYPLIESLISNVIGEKTQIVDPAIQTSLKLKEILLEYALINNQTVKPQYNFYITDNLDKFKQLSEKFLHNNIDHIELVQLDNDC
jgi:glutamate racemase